MSARLPAGVEAGALMRQVQAAGGFATVIARGEPDAGTLMVVLLERGGAARAYERLPDATGHRVWHCVRREDSQEPGAFGEYLQRRHRQDGDLWIVELDIAQGERFIGLIDSTG